MGGQNHVSMKKNCPYFLYAMYKVWRKSESSFSHSCKACCHQHHLSLCEISKYFHEAFLFNLSDSKKKKFPCDKFILKFTRWSIKVNNQFLFGLKLYFTYKLQYKGKDATFTFILWVCDSWMFMKENDKSLLKTFFLRSIIWLYTIIICLYHCYIVIFCVSSLYFVYGKNNQTNFFRLIASYFTAQMHVPFIFTEYMRRKDNSWVLEITLELQPHHRLDT